MIVRRKTLLLSIIALLVLALPASAQRPYKQLKPSSNYWDRTRRDVPAHTTRVSDNRRLVTVGDTLYMLDVRNRIVWTWSSQGPPLTGIPIEDSTGTMYAIGFDLIWVALDSTTGKEKWRGTANGRAVYSQIGLYSGDVYFVLTDMEGYRDGHSARRIKDYLLICRGNSILWDADIPVGSRIEIRGNKLVAVLKGKGRILRKPIAVPDKFGAPIGKVSMVAGYD